MPPGAGRESSLHSKAESDSTKYNSIRNVFLSSLPSVTLPEPMILMHAESAARRSSRDKVEADNSRREARSALPSRSAESEADIAPATNPTAQHALSHQLEINKNNCMIALFRVRAARLLGRRLRSERLQGGGTFFSTDATTFAVPAVDEDLLKSVRETAARFTKRHCEQHVAEWEAERLFPRELYSLAGQDGLLRVGYGEPHGLPGTDAHLDPRYFMAVQDEISKLGCGGISAGLFSSNIAIPPILAAGSDELIERVVPRVLNGERVASLCITEPTGGSDVANITTTATKCDGGYLLNGEKCFITSGTRADVLTVAVRTGSRKDHRGGISLVVVEAHEEEQARGLSRSKMEKTGWHCSDTAVIHFQDVFVPEKNLV